MSELGNEIRRYIDAVTEPISITEVQGGDRVREDAVASRDDGGLRRRSLVVGALVGVAALVALFVIMRPGDPAVRVDVGPAVTPPVSTSAAPQVPPGDSEQPEFELLDMREAAEDIGTLRAAVDEAGLRSLWSDIGFAGQTSEVDFSRWVVVSLTIPDDACPPAFGGFDRSETTWTAFFVEPGTGCNDPLIPKTYVVLVKRAAVAPSFTLRLPAYPNFSLERLLAVEVPPLDTTPPTTVSAAESTGEPVGRVPLPAVGEASAALLPNGRPVWVVHHADGSVTAVPGVVPGTDRSEGLDGLWSLVRWSPAGSFHGPIAWDAWGRAVTAGRHADLVAFTARVEGSDVVIATSDRTRVPGVPVIPSGFGSGLLEPELPPLVELTSGLPEGWSQVDATIVGDEGIARVCTIRIGAPVDALPTCTSSAPAVEGLVVPPGQTTWNFGPLLVEADREGRIIHVVSLGGSAGRAPG